MVRLGYRVRYLLRGQLVDPTEAPGPFIYTYDDRLVVISLKGETRTREGDRTWVNLCEAETEVSVPVATVEAVGHLAQRHVPPEAIASEPGYIGSLLDAAGSLRQDAALPVRFLWPDLQGLIARVESILFDHARRTIAVARWRLGIPGPRQPLQAEARYARFESEWQMLPFYVPAPQWVSSSGRVGERFRHEIERFVAAGGSEPLAQELYREASVGRYERPRSALALAAAAVEAGLVASAADLPNRPQWVSGEARTPPLGHLLDVILPVVAARRPIAGLPLLPPMSVLDVIRQTHRHRSRLMHRGAVSPSEDEVDRALEATHSLLAFLDFYAGHGWALEFVDARVLAEAARSVGLADAGDLIRAAWQLTGVRRSVFVQG